MREERIDILSDESLARFNAICFTSNGVVKSNGDLVMGAGVAKAFRDRFDWLADAAGTCVRLNGNRCQIIGGAQPQIIAFSTKHHWKNQSDITLIEKSAKELMKIVEAYGWREVALPRPGCANGGLNWADVKPLLESIFDDRIVIVVS